MGTRDTEGENPARGLDLGSAGASARAEFERRRAHDDLRRRKRFGRVVASLVRSIAGDTPATRAWQQGGHAEEKVGAFLNRALGSSGVILHDRAVPGSRANIDHIAIVPSGVWIIDTKRYRGRVQRRNLGWWLSPRPALFVNGRDRTNLISSVQRQGTRIARVAGAGPLLHCALCFVDAEWGHLSRSFTIDGVTVTSMRPLADALHSKGPLHGVSIRALAQHISVDFPSYDTSIGGTGLGQPDGAPQ